MPDTYGYKYTLRICNNYYFYAATEVVRTRLNVTLYVHCFSCYFLTHSIPFKSLSSLPNQRNPNPIFTPINNLGLLPGFLISSSLSATRNNILSTDHIPLKSHVPNFTTQCTKTFASPAFTTKFPICCSLAVFFGLLRTFLRTLPCTSRTLSHSPFTHPHFNHGVQY